MVYVHELKKQVVKKAVKVLLEGVRQVNTK